MTWIIRDRRHTPVEFRTGAEAWTGKKTQGVFRPYGGGVTVEACDTRTGNIEVVVDPENYSPYMGPGIKLPADPRLILAHEFGHALAFMLGYHIGDIADNSSRLVVELAVMFENLYRAENGDEALRRNHNYDAPFE